VQELMSQIQAIFQDVFNDPGLSVNAETTASDVPGWDSLANINLIFAMESEFSIKFALGEIQELNNVGEMAASIRKKQEQPRKA
jgi:acyl carrier protein